MDDEILALYLDAGWFPDDIADFLGLEPEYVEDVIADYEDGF